MNSSDNNDKKVALVRQKKSTLTQQKNKKRQRATPQQLQVLQNEFMINSTPNAKTREEIGKKIDMTERSVQIWFQNKRAKSKQFSRKNSTNSQYGSVQGIYETTSLVSPKTDTFYNDTSVETSYFSSSNSSDNNGTASITDTAKTLSKFFLPCLSISIGTWKRIPTTVSGFSNNLQVFFSLSDATMSYMMFNDTTKFLIKFPMKDVEMFTYIETDSVTDIAHLQIELTKRPSFYLRNFAMGDQWSRCQDFTELCQASSIFFHNLTGPASQLKPQLLCIAQLYPQKFCGLSTDTFSNDISLTGGCSDSSLEMNKPQSLAPSPMTKPPAFGSNLNQKTSLLFPETENLWCFTRASVSVTGATTPALEPANNTCTSPDSLAKPLEENHSELVQSFQQENILDITSNVSRHGSATSTDTILTAGTDISSSELSEPVEESQDSMLITAPFNLDMTEETTNFSSYGNMLAVSSAFGSEESDVTESLRDDPSLWALIQA